MHTAGSFGARRRRSPGTDRAAAGGVPALHRRLELPELKRLFREFRDAPLVSISDAQRRPLPRARWVATVYNGVELDQLTFNPRGGDYLAWLGRISPEKGLDAAIR